MISKSYHTFMLSQHYRTKRSQGTTSSRQHLGVTGAENTGLFTALLCLGTVILAVSFIRNINVYLEGNRRLSALKSEVDQAQKEVDDIQAKVDEAQTVEYQEQLIRDELGLAREGELILILPPEAEVRAASPLRAQVAPHTQEDDPNWKLWLKLFI